jgi:hypothetical protein
MGNYSVVIFHVVWKIYFPYFPLIVAVACIPPIHNFLASYSRPETSWLLYFYSKSSARKDGNIKKKLWKSMTFWAYFWTLLTGFISVIHHTHAAFRYSDVIFFYLDLRDYRHCGHSWPIVPVSGDNEDDCGERDGM